MRNVVLLIVMSSVILSAQTSPLSPESRAQFHGQMSEPVEPFRIIGNIYYVGARNIASYLITTPQGHIMIDTGTSLGSSCRTSKSSCRDMRILTMCRATRP